MITSADIAQHTAEFLAAGGEIQLIPFLFTKKAGHPDVAAYVKRMRYAYYIEGVDSLSVSGKEDHWIPDAVLCNPRLYEGEI